MKTATCIRLSALALIVLLLGASSAAAQLSISPNGILMKPGVHSGEVVVRNPGEKAMVVTTRMMYAVLRTDSTGTTFKDSAADVRSAVDWMRAFPRQFTLAPGASRTVKVMATPPADLADGEWLSRLEIKGIPADRPEQLDVDSSQMGVQLNYTYGYSYPAVYHKGELTTGIDYSAVGAIRSKEGTAVLMRLNVSGNCTYRGTFFMTVEGPTLKTPKSFEAPIVATVGYDQPIPLPSLPAGTYTLKVKAASVRRGGQGEHLVKAPTVSKEFTLTLDNDNVTVASR